MCKLNSNVIIYVYLLFGVIGILRPPMDINKNNGCQDGSKDGPAYCSTNDGSWRECCNCIRRPLTMFLTKTWRSSEKGMYRWKIFDFYMWWRIGNVIGSMLNLWNRYESVKYCILIFIKVYSGDLFSTCYFFQNLSVCNCEFFLIILTMWEVKKFKKYSVIIIF